MGDRDQHAAGINQIHEHAMTSDAPLVKIRLIERSWRCFAFGIVAILPVIGIPFAVVAINSFRQVFFGRSNVWNPAERYLRVGMACATLGVLLDLLIAGIIAIEIS